MSLKPGALNKDGALLTADQVKRVRAATTGQPPPAGIPGCHYPHNAIVFYDAAKKPVAFIEVCFTCRGTVASPEEGAKGMNLDALAAIFDEHKLPMGPYADLKAFQQRK